MHRRDGCLTARASTCPAAKWSRHTASNQLQVTPWVHDQAISGPSEFLCPFQNSTGISSKLLLRLIELSRLLFCDPLFCCYPAVDAMSGTVQTAFRWVDIRQSKFPFQSAPTSSGLTLLWPFLFQEYFYKSQESLATVIDFVEEKVEKKKRTDGSEKTEEETEDSFNTSTHSSPLFPASRKRPKNLDPRRRLTP